MLKIVFMGTPAFSVPILEALIKEYEVVLVVTQPDKEVGRKREIMMSPVKMCAMAHNIPVFQIISVFHTGVPTPFHEKVWDGLFFFIM